MIYIYIYGSSLEPAAETAVFLPAAIDECPPDASKRVDTLPGVRKKKPARLRERLSLVVNLSMFRIHKYCMQAIALS